MERPSLLESKRLTSSHSSLRLLALCSIVLHSFKRRHPCIKKCGSTNSSLWISPNSLISHAFQASAILSIELVQPFHICAWQAQPVSILDIAKRDLKAVLAAASMHTAYYHASRSARKDLTASQHCFDFPSTGSAKRMCVNNYIAW